MMDEQGNKRGRAIQANDEPCLNMERAKKRSCHNSSESTSFATIKKLSQKELQPIFPDKKNHSSQLATLRPSSPALDAVHSYLQAAHYGPLPCAKKGRKLFSPFCTARVQLFRRREFTTAAKGRKPLQTRLSRGRGGGGESKSFGGQEGAFFFFLSSAIFVLPLPPASCLAPGESFHVYCYPGLATTG